MKDESHNIEFKETWRDDYLKWVCGFANAHGGSLFVGIKDNGDVCGVEDARKLMEDLPNKVRDLLGILVEVNLKTKDGLEFIEIVTEAYPYPISYRGYYYQRCGATNQELKGAALDRFMLRKQGKTWDGVPVPYLNVEDLDDKTFELFRKKALRSRRMDETDLADNNEELLDKLRLLENNYLKRAAALLFHPDPEKYVTGAYIKIGFFRADAELVYQDEVHGNLFQQVKATLDLITTKYLRALISYEGIQRVETLPVPREALREAILNSVVHKTYESLTPIQIAVYDDKMEICNCGVLPDDWTLDNLLVTHRSRPYNPDIANAFFRAGEIEAWGRGIQRIISACKSAGCPSPNFKFVGGELWTTFYYDKMDVPQMSHKCPTNVPQNVPQNIIQGYGLTQRQYDIVNLIALNPQMSNNEVSNGLNIAVRTIRREVSLLVDLGLINNVGSSKNCRWEVKNVPKDVPQNVPKDVPQKHELTKRQSEILNLIALNSQLTRSEIAERLNVGIRTVKRDISELTALGVLRYVGSAKSGSWEILV